MFCEAIKQTNKQNYSSTPQVTLRTSIHTFIYLYNATTSALNTQNGQHPDTHLRRHCRWRRSVVCRHVGGYVDQSRHVRRNRDVVTATVGRGHTPAHHHLRTVPERVLGLGRCAGQRRRRHEQKSVGVVRGSYDGATHCVRPKSSKSPVMARNSRGFTNQVWRCFVCWFVELLHTTR